MLVHVQDNLLAAVHPSLASNRARSCQSETVFPPLNRPRVPDLCYLSAFGEKTGAVRPSGSALIPG